MAKDEDGSQGREPEKPAEMSEEEQQALADGSFKFDGEVLDDDEEFLPEAEAAAEAAEAAKAAQTDDEDDWETPERKSTGSKLTRADVNRLYLGDASVVAKNAEAETQEPAGVEDLFDEGVLEGKQYPDEPEPEPKPEPEPAEPEAEEDDIAAKLGFTDLPAGAVSPEDAATMPGGQPAGGVIKDDDSFTGYSKDGVPSLARPTTDDQGTEGPTVPMAERPDGLDEALDEEDPHGSETKVDMDVSAALAMEAAVSEDEGPTEEEVGLGDPEPVAEPADDDLRFVEPEPAPKQEPPLTPAPIAIGPEEPEHIQAEPTYDTPAVTAEEGGLDTPPPIPEAQVQPEFAAADAAEEQPSPEPEPIELDTEDSAVVPATEDDLKQVEARKDGADTGASMRSDDCERRSALDAKQYLALKKQVKQIYTLLSDVQQKVMALQKDYSEQPGEIESIGKQTSKISGLEKKLDGAVKILNEFKIYLDRTEESDEDKTALVQQAVALASMKSTIDNYADLLPNVQDALVAAKEKLAELAARSGEADDASDATAGAIEPVDYNRIMQEFAKHLEEELQFSQRIGDVAAAQRKYHELFADYNETVKPGIDGIKRRINTLEQAVEDVGKHTKASASNAADTYSVCKQILEIITADAPAKAKQESDEESGEEDEPTAVPEPAPELLTQPKPETVTQPVPQVGAAGDTEPVPFDFSELHAVVKKLEAYIESRNQADFKNNAAVQETAVKVFTRAVTEYLAEKKTADDDSRKARDDELITAAVTLNENYVKSVADRLDESKTQLNQWLETNKPLTKEQVDGIVQQIATLLDKAQITSQSLTSLTDYVKSAKAQAGLETLSKISKLETQLSGNAKNTVALLENISEHIDSMKCMKESAAKLEKLLAATKGLGRDMVQSGKDFNQGAQIYEKLAKSQKRRSRLASAGLYIGLTLAAGVIAGGIALFGPKILAKYAPSVAKYASTTPAANAVPYDEHETAVKTLQDKIADLNEQYGKDQDRIRLLAGEKSAAELARDQYKADAEAKKAEADQGEIEKYKSEAEKQKAEAEKYKAESTKYQSEAEKYKGQLAECQAKPAVPAKSAGSIDEKVGEEAKKKAAEEKKKRQRNRRERRKSKSAPKPYVPDY